MKETTRFGSALLAEGQTDTQGSSAQKLLATGGVIAALGASSCCLLPFLLFTLGISGAWIGNLTALGRYQPIFLAGAVAFLAIGFWRTYRKPPPSNCAPGSYCARSASSRIAKIGLWTATLLVIAAATFPYIARLILDA